MAYMYDELQFTRYTLVDGNFVPMTGLETGNLVKFKKVANTSSQVPYTAITYQGGGSYLVSGFLEDDGITILDEIIACYIEIDGVIEYEYGIVYVGAPDRTFVRRDGAFAMKAALDLGTYKIVNLGTPSANTDATNKYYVDLAVATLNTSLSASISALASGVAILATRNTFTGLNTFSNTVVFVVDLGVSPSKYPQLSTYEPPTDDLHITCKKYVDDRFASVVGVVQSPYTIKLIEGLTASNYSKQTLEACVTYLNGVGLTVKKRGQILIEYGSTSGNEFEVLASAWFDDYIDIFAYALTKIKTNNSGNSLTSDTILTNIWLYDNSEKSSEAFTNWTFRNCRFDDTYANYTFNNCTFEGTNYIKGNATVSLASCKGSGIRTNCVVTTSGGTEPTDIIDTISASNLF